MTERKPVPNDLKLYEHHVVKAIELYAKGLGHIALLHLKLTRIFTTIGYTAYRVKCHELEIDPFPDLETDTDQPSAEGYVAQ